MTFLSLSALQNKLECLSLVCFFWLVWYCQVRLGANPSERQRNDDRNGKNQTSLIIFAMDEHSGLFCSAVSNEEKKSLITFSADARLGGEQEEDEVGCFRRMQPHCPRQPFQP